MHIEDIWDAQVAKCHRAANSCLYRSHKKCIVCNFFVYIFQGALHLVHPLHPQWGKRRILNPVFKSDSRGYVSIVKQCLLLFFLFERIAKQTLSNICGNAYEKYMKAWKKTTLNCLKYVRQDFSFEIAETNLFGRRPQDDHGSYNKFNPEK